MSGKQRCYIDSNIWLYAFIETDDAVKTTLARNLIQTVEPVISTQVINEVSVNLIRKAGFSEKQIRLLIISFFTKYDVLPVTQMIMLNASQLRDRYSLSFWDSLIVASALSASVSYLYSEDMQDGLLVATQLQIINPFKSE
ncbi:MAG TPA: PIN domain-containing protein [Anaerolineae bacterium]|nr:PIN domain-containing protein [Anaerolineae bacterium]